MTPRRVARGLLITPDGRILLLKAREPSTGREFWFPPGGGIEPGETDLQALKRELFEETGLANPDVGPAVWTRTADFVWDGRRIVEDEVYWLMEMR